MRKKKKKSLIKSRVSLPSACVSSIIRITYIPQMLTALDATYVISGAMYWSVIEINIGILAASIPSFKPIASRYAPRLLGSSYNQSGKGGRNGSSYLKSSGLGRSKNGTMELRSVERGDRFGCESFPIPPFYGNHVLILT